MTKKQDKQKKLITVEIALYTLFLILFYFAVFVNKRFGDISFEQLLYNITNTKGANFDIVLVGVFFIAIRLVIIFGIITGIYLLFKYLKIELIFNINIKNKTRKFSLFKKSKIKSIILLVIFITFILYKTIDLLNINEYVKNQLSKSTIFEEYYVDGSKVKLEFPKKKRNLIYIYAESMESTNACRKVIYT